MDQENECKTMRDVTQLNSPHHSTQGCLSQSTTMREEIL